MIDILKRDEVQVLRRAGHVWKEIAPLGGGSVRPVRRIVAETDNTAIDDGARTGASTGRSTIEGRGVPRRAHGGAQRGADAALGGIAPSRVNLGTRRSAIEALAQTLRIRNVTRLVRSLAGG